MVTWFTVKVKYTKEFQDGQLKRVTEPYLVDATSFTDAEARIYDELGSFIRGEFNVTNIAKTDFADIFHYEDCEQWYKCKISYTTEDADNGKEKKISQNFLITAHNIKEAYERLHESLDSLMVTFQVLSITTSPIVDIFPYTGEDRVLTPEEREAYDHPQEEAVVASATNLSEEAFENDSEEEDDDDENVSINNDDEASVEEEEEK